MGNEGQRRVLTWLPWRRIVVLNLLPLAMFIAATFVLLPPSERPVLWGFAAVVSVGWAVLVYGATTAFGILESLKRRLTGRGHPLDDERR